jgi:hypothetical protein
MNGCESSVFNFAQIMWLVFHNRIGQEIYLEQQVLTFLVNKQGNDNIVNCKSTLKKLIIIRFKIV